MICQTHSDSRILEKLGGGGINAVYGAEDGRPWPAFLTLDGQSPEGAEQESPGRKPWVPKRA